MKLKTILRPSLIMTLVVMCQLPLTFTTGARAMMKPSPEPRPDLTILSAIYKEPKVSVRITNAGDAAAPPSVVAVLLLKRLQPGTNKPEAIGFPIPALSPGQIIDKTFNIGNNPFTDNGALAVRVDYKNQILESDERNNYKKVSIAPLPDLVIQSVELNNTKATVTVFNKCNGRSDAAKLEMLLYLGPKKSGGGGGVSTDVPPLVGNTGAKIVIDLNVSKISIPSFNGRYLRLDIDPSNKIKEAVETNNWWETGAAPFPDPVNSCNPPK